MGSEKHGDTSSFEVDSQDHSIQKKIKTLRHDETIRIGMLALATAMGITILGLGADVYSVYQHTHVPGDYLLALWPDELSVAPTAVLVAGSAIVVLVNLVTLIVSKVEFLRSKRLFHSLTSIIAPFIGTVLAVVTVGEFWAINASNTDDTLLSWTCRWKSVPMGQQPYFGTLCHENWAAVIMAIVVMVLEIGILALGSYQWFLERHIVTTVRSRQDSPVMS
ncbi:hypothetical protein CONLIGDRAFT_677498 [Coniochaeta ligniaria NRRL 30616]|uniref:Uncharacterized protein n=1 Tax=Coniochaeta ligniaria NRRL 30616 TaxID=1408157 RepID=A0A1J7K0V0_9PEZI|nr:hypothetical protein CONLIGDRAFT_677498 [Coniochaeta ligniaria NRRL 30616]